MKEGPACHPDPTPACLDEARLEVGEQCRDFGLAPPARDVRTNVIRHAAGGDVNQPSARIVWHPLPGPLL